MLPGITLGQKPSVKASVSESVAGSTSHDAVLLVAVESVVPLVVGGVVGLAALASTVIAADAALVAELVPDLFATVVNVYAEPAVRPVMVHEPDAPVTVHFAPPGDALTSYEVGVTPAVGAVTVMVALSSPATTLGVPGTCGPTTLFVTDSGPKETASAPVGL